MAKEYMVGTVDDQPLLMITLNGTKYFVDVAKSEVFLDAVGLPRITDDATVTAVIAMVGA